MAYVTHHRFRHRPSPRLSPRPPARTEEHLLARVAVGDAGAFASLYDAFAPAVYGVALRVVVDPSLAEEVTQETFAAAWSTAGAFDAAKGSARSWVLTIAHRRAVDVVRHEQAARNRIDRAGAASRERPAADIADEVVDQVARTEDALAIHRALGALTELQRAAVELAYFKGCTYQQVADILQVPLGTAKTRIRDGLRRLARELAPLDIRVETRAAAIALTPVALV